MKFLNTSSTESLMGVIASYENIFVESVCELGTEDDHFWVFMRSKHHLTLLEEISFHLWLCLLFRLSLRLVFDAKLCLALASIF